MSLTTPDAVALIERYGPTIKTVSGQVARQYAAAAGRKGHGYEVVPAEDIEQAVYEQLLTSGMGADDLDAMAEPQGYIRTTARLYGAANEAKARRRAVQVDLSDNGDTDDASLGSALVNDPRHAATYGNPEDEVIAEDFIASARAVVERILGNIGSLNSREVARLFYLGGLDSVAIAARLRIEGAAVRKALQRARGDIGPEADASLRAWREFAHPTSKRPQTTGARPTALLALVG